MATPVVSFNGVILGGANAYGWPFVSGVAPVDLPFTVSAARAKELEGALGQAGILDVEGETWEQIYLLEIQPGATPHEKRIRLADRRWLWPKVWVPVSLNIRRATGDTLLVGGDRLENRAMLDELRYARYSLFPPANPAAPWTAQDALVHVVTDLLGCPVRFKDEPPAQVEIQDLILDDPGPDAVERVLAYLPGMALYIDRQGDAVVYDTASGEEADILAAAPSFQVGGGIVEVVDRSALRPSKVVVLFTPEIEQRFDYTEPRSGGTRTRDDDTPVLRSVAQSPDVETLIDGERVVRGSYVEQEKLFEAWGPFGRFNQPVSFDVLRRFSTKYGAAAFTQAWGNNPHTPPNPVNTARAETAIRSWRRLFQIDAFWTQRLESIRPYRASIILQSRGVYAPSEVFADWTRRPSFYGFASGNDANQNQGWAVRGYPQSGKLDDAKAAPAQVSVVDVGAGIIQIEPALDLFGLNQAQWFGYPEEGKLPSQALGQAKRQGDALYRHWYLVEFEAGWQLAVVLTVVPGSPNSAERFYQVEVDPSEIAPEVGDSNGPVVTVRIFPGVMTARFGWRDEQREAIEAAVKGEGPYSAIDELLLNEPFVRDVARAAAARVYEPLRDRPLGNMTVHWSPAMEPGGTVNQVTHMMQGGQLVTKATFAAPKQASDIWRYLNASTRKAVLRVLNDPGSAG